MFFMENSLISPNQSDFMTEEACINQLFCIAHGIFTSCDDGYEGRGLFLDIIKTFNKLWAAGLHYQLKQSSITDSS